MRWLPQNTRSPAGGLRASLWLTVCRAHTPHPGDLGNSWEHKTDSSNIAVCVSQTRDYGGVTLRESYSTLLGWSVLPKSWLLLASTWTEWVKSLSSVWTLEASQAAVDQNLKEVWIATQLLILECEGNQVRREVALGAPNVTGPAWEEMPAQL